MTETETLSTDPKEGRRRRPLNPLVAGAAAFGVCCGLPLLGSLGFAGAVVGLGAGSRIGVVVASTLAVIGVLMWRRHRTGHPSKSTTCSPPVVRLAGSTLHHQESQR